VQRTGPQTPHTRNSKELVSKSKDPVEFSIGSKEYKIPRKDCCLLPLPSTSAEELAEYLAGKLFQALRPEGDIESVSVCVNEGIGQGAYFTKTAD
jgi:hypothetical protein